MVPKISNNLLFFLFKLLVSFEFIIYPSKAALFHKLFSLLQEKEYSSEVNFSSAVNINSFLLLN